MTVVHLLGTGTPELDPKRCGSGVAVTYDDGWILIDCGRGVTQRIAEAGLDLSRLQAVCLTHHHTDHVSDLATLAIARWSSGGPGALLTIAPRGPTADFATACLDGFTDQAFYAQAAPESAPRPAIDVRSFAAQGAPTSIPGPPSLELSAVLVDHHPIEAAVGYRIAVGTVVLVVSGDTAACAGIEEMARGAELLVHQALLGGAVRPQLLEWNASAESVGALAERAGVKQLVLTHLIPAPADVEDEERYCEDVRRGGFGGPVHIARDRMRIVLG